MTDTMPQDAPSVTGVLPLYADARPALAHTHKDHGRLRRTMTARSSWLDVQCWTSTVSEQRRALLIRQDGATRHRVRP